MQEIQIRLNKLEYSNTGNVTTSAQSLKEIFTDAPTSNVKTVLIHVPGTTEVYFGSDNTVTTSNGALIREQSTREFAIMDLNLAPYFIAASTVDIRIEVWS